MLNIVGHIIGFFTGSKTIAAANQLLTIVSRGIDKGFKDQHDHMADFVWDRLDKAFKHPEGSLTKDELRDVVEHAIGLMDGVWNALHKD